MFEDTFRDCDSLTTIPAGLFSHVSGSATNMFKSTFNDCGALVSFPINLFSGVTGDANTMFQSTFNDCVNLASITNNGTSTNYIPGTFLSAAANGSATTPVLKMFKGTAFATTCPAGTYTATPTHFGDAERPWCSPCAAGTYTNTAGQSTCTPCATGYSNTGTGNTSCTANSYTCSAGEYLKASNATCTTCPAGKYCAGGTFTYNGSDQGQTTCPANSYCKEGSDAPTACSSLGGGLYTKSATGSDAASDCYLTTTAGRYIAASTDTAQTDCPSGYYCTSQNVYYPNGNTPTPCPEANSSREWTTGFPNDFYSPTRTSYSLTSGTKRTKITACYAGYTFTNARGTFSVSAYYNSTTDKYDTISSSGKYYSVLNAGYYGTTKYYDDATCNSSITGSTKMLYRDAQPCPAGSYCPGISSMPKCNTGTYNDTMGINACAEGFFTNAEGQSSCTACITGYSNSGTGNTSCTATITLNKNGGSGTIQGTSGSGNASVTCTQGASCSFGSASGLTKTGYTFKTGWGTDSSCTSTTNSFTNPTGTYYACRTANTLTINLNKNGGTGTCGGQTGTTTGSMTCTYNGTCTTPTWNSSTCNITNGSGASQKVLTGWNTKADGTGTSYGLNASIKNIISSGSITLYAVWSDPVCSITNGSGTSSVSSNTPTCAISCTDGYSQSGYTNTTTSFSNTGTAGNKTVTGSCSPRTYKVTLDPKRYTSTSDNSGTAATSNGTTSYWYVYKRGPGTGHACYYFNKEITSASDAANSANCIAGTNGVSITNPTLTGYMFGGYYVTKTGTGTQYVTSAGVTTGNLYNNVAANTTLFAKWTANTINIVWKGVTSQEDLAANVRQVSYDGDIHTPSSSNLVQQSGADFVGWRFKKS